MAEMYFGPEPQEVLKSVLPTNLLILQWNRTSQVYERKSAFTDKVFVTGRIYRSIYIYKASILYVTFNLNAGRDPRHIWSKQFLWIKGVLSAGASHRETWLQTMEHSYMVNLFLLCKVQYCFPVNSDSSIIVGQSIKWRKIDQYFIHDHWSVW
jgi:hypothetical protein